MMLWKAVCSRMGLKGTYVTWEEETVLEKPIHMVLPLRMLVWIVVTDLEIV